MTPTFPDDAPNPSPRGRALAQFLTSKHGQLWVIFLAALLIRLAYGLPHARIPGGNDMGVYHQLAVGLLTGTGYVSQLEPHFLSWRAPGYPIFLAGLYRLAGQHAGVVVVVQGILSALTCVLVARLAWPAFGKKVAIASGLICAVNPQMIHWSGEYLTETLFTLLLVLAVQLCVDINESTRSRRQGQHWRPILAGLVLGYATLVRPNLLVFLPFVSLYMLFFAGGSGLRRVTIAVAVPMLALAVLLPWTIRNYSVHGEFVPVASIGGVALFVGIPPSMLPPTTVRRRPLPDWKFLEDGQHKLPNGYDLLPELFARRTRQRLSSDFDELEQSRLGRSIFLQFAREEPRQFVELTAMKASQTFNVLPKQHNYRLGPYDVIVRYIETTFLSLTFALGSLGILLAAWRNGTVVMLLAVLTYHVTFQAIFRPDPRYFMPGIVLLTPFSALGLFEARGLVERWQGGGRDTRTRLSVWVAVLIALGMNAYYHAFVLRSHYLVRDWQKITTLITGGAP